MHDNGVEVDDADAALLMHDVLWLDFGMDRGCFVVDVAQVDEDNSSECPVARSGLECRCGGC
ncbi:unnamed protein product [Mycena citricolor]|uniref:Uncharacterized protein n=1 Tax=Mycena citricolor TaxID=2018698 RepID=A0AAD2K007_9AGAR|nr:unnamed protein product [Mycena citricolor]